MKKNNLLLISSILSVAYLVYLVVYFSGSISGTEGAEQAGATIASVLVMPHAIVVGIGTIFNILGWTLKGKGFTLTAGILYAVGMFLFPVYFMFVIIQMILTFVGYNQMKKASKQQLLAS